MLIYGGNEGERWRLYTNVVKCIDCVAVVGDKDVCVLIFEYAGFIGEIVHGYDSIMSEGKSRFDMEWKKGIDIWTRLLNSFRKELDLPSIDIASIRKRFMIEL